MSNSQVYQQFLETRESHIASFIKQYVVDGTKLNKNGKSRIFLATNGSWQEQYLSFYEVLHDKYVARFLAAALLDKYLQIIQTEVDQLLSRKLPEEVFSYQLDLLYEKLRFNKIITVTVSSQLIGVAMRELISSNDKYKMLRRRGEVNKLKAAPSLLVLSSYYSFDEEKPFNQINTEDQVVIVNDVISTGNLIYTLYDKITSTKGAEIKAVFCLADTRLRPQQIIDKHTEASYRFDETIEQGRFFSLANSSDGLIIRKFVRPHPRKPDVEVKRINPLLNAIVELRSTYGEEQKILFPRPAELLSEHIFHENVFKIGHFQQNLTHNGYLTDMHSIFSCDNKEHSTGVRLLEKLKEKVIENRLVTEPIESLFRNIAYNLQGIKKWKLDQSQFGDVEKIERTLEVLIQNIDPTAARLHFKPDFIFYPVFSGIEQLDHDILSKVFGTQVSNIIGLQRFDTSKGWRFPFPAKRFNQITKNKRILILDSGSLTGESLIQLIDNIAFLDVQDITVLSVIARIEDFYREFYSKLRSTKVKLLRQGEFHGVERRDLPDHIVPLNMLFGINLHIPVYASAVVCPFCKELQEIAYFEELTEKFVPSEWTKNYFSNRKKELGIVQIHEIEQFHGATYMPKRKKAGVIDSIPLLLMRDRLGKIESYRFYPDYFEYFDGGQEVEEENFYTEPFLQRNKELVLAIILHEPKLLDIIKDLLIEIKDCCQEVIESIINQRNQIGNLFYDWPKCSILRLAFIFYKDKVLDLKHFEFFFEFAEGDLNCFNFLSFQLWKGYFNIEKDKNIETKCSDILLQMAKNFDAEDLSQHTKIYRNETVRDLIKDITEHFKPTETDDVNQAYFNLMMFFVSMSSKVTHDELSRYISRLAVINQNVKVESSNNAERLAQLYHDAGAIISSVRTNIIQNLTVIRNEKTLKKVHQTSYQMLFDPKDSIYSDFERLHNKYKLVNPPQLTNTEDFGPEEWAIKDVVFDIEEFQTKYLLRQKPFYHYVIKYRCDLMSCIRHACSSAEAKKKMLERKDFDCHFHNGNPIYINAHEDLLTAALAEIVANAAAESGNDSSTLEFSVEEIPKTTEVKLIVKQQAPFQETFSHYGGYYKEVIPILNIFGKSGSLHITPTPSFTITVIFNKNILDKI